MLTLSLAALVSAAPAPPADWFDRLSTEGGTEVRVDPRILSLFAILNAGGLDEGPVARTLPVPRVAYGPFRERIRGLVVGTPLGPEVQAYLDAHQEPISRYVEAALGGSPLDGLDRLMTRTWEGWGLAAAMEAEDARSRAMMRAWLPVLDGPVERARTMLGLTDTVAVVVVVNPLDAPDRARAARVGNELLVAVGPAEPPSAARVVEAMARAVAAPAAARVRWPGGPAVLKDAAALGATETSPPEYAASLVARAAALLATQAPDAQWDAAARSGYFGLREVATTFQQGRPIETWLGETLQRIERLRTGKK